MSNTTYSYEFRPSAIERNSLESVRVRYFKGEKAGEDRGCLYRYQGLGDDDVTPVYRDLDGNFKPKDQLTIDPFKF